LPAFSGAPESIRAAVGPDACPLGLGAGPFEAEPGLVESPASVAGVWLVVVDIVMF
jgi:hypothetical protein